MVKKGGWSVPGEAFTHSVHALVIYVISFVVDVASMTDISRVLSLLKSILIYITLLFRHVFTLRITIKWTTYHDSVAFLLFFKKKNTYTC